MHEALQTRWGQAEKRARVGEWLHSRVLQLNASAVDAIARKAKGKSNDKHGTCSGGGDGGAADSCGGAGGGSSSSGGSGGVEREPTRSASSASSMPPTRSTFPRSWFAGIAEGGFNVLWQMGIMGKPAAPTVAAEWQSGLVDVHFLNNCGGGEAPAILYRRRTTSPNDSMEATGVEIAPGKSVRLVSHEREGWEARAPAGEPGGAGGDSGASAERVIGKWEIDRGNGVVQHAVLCPGIAN